MPFPIGLPNIITPLRHLSVVPAVHFASLLQSVAYKSRGDSGGVREFSRLR
jgi:hypothetical protein